MQTSQGGKGREEEEDGVSEYYWRGDGNCYSRKVRRPS